LFKLPLKNGRKYTPRKTFKGEKVQLRLSQKVYHKLSNLVEEGFYLSINDAIRDALNFFLYIEPYRKRFIIKDTKDLAKMM